MHTPPHHQDMLQKVQVAQSAFRPVPQGSGSHLLADVRVEGRLLETERNVEILKQEELADESLSQQSWVVQELRQDTLPAASEASPNSTPWVEKKFLLHPLPPLQVLCQSVC